MGRFPGEDSCLPLVWAVLDLLITHETNGIRFTQPDRQRLNRTSYTPPQTATTEEVTAAKNHPQTGNLNRRECTAPMRRDLVAAVTSPFMRAGRRRRRMGSGAARPIATPSRRGRRRLPWRPDRPTNQSDDAAR
jgi:hypothetical protein